MPLEFVALSDLDAKARIPRGTVLVFGSRETFRMADARPSAGFDDLDGPVFQIFPVEIDGESLVAALSHCHSMPDELCEVVVEQRVGLDDLHREYVFACGCTLAGEPTRGPDDSRCARVLVEKRDRRGNVEWQSFDCMKGQCPGDCVPVSVPGPFGGVEYGCECQEHDKGVSLQQRLSGLLRAVADRLDPARY